MPRKKIEELPTEAVEQVVNIPLADFRYFENHPFKVTDDEAMIETTESVKEYGVLMPALARPHPDGGYELKFFWYRCEFTKIQAKRNPINVNINVIKRATTQVRWLINTLTLYAFLNQTGQQKRNNTEVVPFLYN